MTITCPLCQKTIANSDLYEPSMLILARYLHSAHGFTSGCPCGENIYKDNNFTGDPSPEEKLNWFVQHLKNLGEPIDVHLLFHALRRERTPFGADATGAAMIRPIEARTFSAATTALADLLKNGRRWNT